MIFTEYNFFKFNFIEPASPLMYGIIELHDHIFFFLNMILFLVLFLLASTLKYFIYSNNTKKNRYLLSQSTNLRFGWIRLNHGTTIEILWTIIPSVILVLIAIPSFALLYATDELVDPSVTVQVIAHQWYWSYEYNDLVIADRSTAVLTNQKEEANLVQKFLHTLALATNHGIVTNTDDREAFIWLLARPQHVISSDFFGIPEYLWEAYARNALDTLGLKSSYQNIVVWYNMYVSPEADPCGHDRFGSMLAWADMIGLWWRQKALVGNIEFDSYLKQESDLSLGERRLQETDFPLILPKFTHIRFMITSEDVIHSWSVPALGIKVDAVPGRINHAHTYIKRSGTFFGQCSELCGVNHGFMPIQIIAFEPSMYYNYLRLVLLNK